MKFSAGERMPSKERNRARRDYRFFRRKMSRQGKSRHCSGAVQRHRETRHSLPKFLSRTGDAFRFRENTARQIWRCKTRREERKIYATFRSHFAVSIALRIHNNYLCLQTHSRIPYARYDDRIVAIPETVICARIYIFYKIESRTSKITQLVRLAGANEKIIFDSSEGFNKERSARLASQKETTAAARLVKTGEEAARVVKSAKVITI